MALTQISTDGIKNGTITGSDLATNVDLVDNQALRFGTGNDLVLRHNGSSSYIENSTGFLFIHANDIALRSIAQENYIVCDANAEVELYYDGSKKFETTSTGVKIPDSLLEVNKTGGNAEIQVTRASGCTLTIQSQTNKSRLVTGASNHELQLGTNGSGRILINDTTVDLPQDNQKLRIGVGQDLQIYHDGNHSFVENTTGLLILQDTSGIYLRTDDLRLQSSGGSETYATLTKDGAVSLNFDNSTKFETTSTGATLTGHFLPDVTDSRNLGSSSKKWASAHLKYNLYMADNAAARFGDSDDLQIFHDGSNSFIRDTGTGSLVVTSSTFAVNNAASTEQMMKAVENGAVELNYDGSKKFETHSGGVSILGNLSLTNADSYELRLGASSDFKFLHNGTDSKITNTTGNLIITQSDGIIRLDPKTNENGILIRPDGATELYHNNNKKLETTSSGVNVTGAITVNGSALTTATNSPAFSAKLSSTVNRNGEGTVVFDSEHLDTDSCYDTSNGRFTPDVAGNYMITFTFVMNGSSGGIIAGAFGAIRKNGSELKARFWTDPMQSNNNQLNRASCSGSAIIPMNGSSDFIEIRAYGLTTTGGNVRVDGDGSNFSGFKLA